MYIYIFVCIWIDRYTYLTTLSLHIFYRTQTVFGWIMTGEDSNSPGVAWAHCGLEQQDAGGPQGLPVAMDGNQGHAPQTME